MRSRRSPWPRSTARRDDDGRGLRRPRRPSSIAARWTACPRTSTRPTRWRAVGPDADHQLTAAAGRSGPKRAAGRGGCWPGDRYPAGRRPAGDRSATSARSCRSRRPGRARDIEVERDGAAARDYSLTPVQDTEPRARRSGALGIGPAPSLEPIYVTDRSLAVRRSAWPKPRKQAREMLRFLARLVTGKASSKNLSGRHRHRPVAPSGGQARRFQAAWTSWPSCR